MALEILFVSNEITSVYADSDCTVQEIGETSTKLITFIDLAGHHKYLKTTISALTGQCSHSGSFNVIYCGIFKLKLPRAHVLRFF